MIGRWRTVPRDQACAVLGIGPWDLAGLIAGGALPHRITERALEKYIAAHLPGRSRPVVCGFCSQPAAWRWVPHDQFMCDDHAAQTDLDELEDLTAVTP